MDGEPGHCVKSVYPGLSDWRAYWLTFPDLPGPSPQYLAVRLYLPKSLGIVLWGCPGAWKSSSQPLIPSGRLVRHSHSIYGFREAGTCLRFSAPLPGPTVCTCEYPIRPLWQPRSVVISPGVWGTLESLWVLGCPSRVRDVICPVGLGPGSGIPRSGALGRGPQKQRFRPGSTSGPLWGPGSNCHPLGADTGGTITRTHFPGWVLLGMSFPPCL